MKDINQVAIDRAIKLVEDRGLSYKRITLIGSNFMSKASEKKQERIFSVLAYKSDPSISIIEDQKKWFTFTFKAGKTQLRDEIWYDGYAEAKQQHEYMVDTGTGPLLIE